MSYEQELKAIIACKQSDGYLVEWAKKQLEQIKSTGGKNGK